MFELFIKYGNTYKHLITQGDGGLILETNNPLEYSFGKAHKSYSIKIPNTGDNNILLDNLFYKTHDHKLSYDDVYYKVDDAVYLKGVLKIYGFNNIEADGQFISMYSILLERLKNTNLTDIEYKDIEDTQINFTLSSGNIDDSEALDLFNGDIVFDLIDRGKTREHQETENVSPDGIVNIITNGVDVAERFPAMRVKRIIENIFDGYTLNGNFFDNTFYEKMYLIYTGERENLSNTEVFVVENRFTATMEEDLVSLANYSSVQFSFNATFELDFHVVKDNINGGYNPSTGVFTVPETGVYHIQYDVKGEAIVTGSAVIDASGEIRLRIIDADTNNVEYEREIPHEYAVSTFPQEGPIGDFGISIGTGNVLLNSGKKYKTNINFTCTPTNSGAWGRSIKISKSGAFFRAVPSTYYGAGSTIQMKKMMPRINVGEFIKSLLKDFNIELFINQETNQVTFNQRKFNETVIDLSEYIVTDSIRVVTNPSPPNWTFKHKLDSADGYMSVVYDNDTDENGDYLFNINSINNKTFESPFSMTVERPCLKWGIGTDNGRIWSNFEEPELSTNFNIRILFDNGIKSCDYDLLTPTGRINKTTFRQLSTKITTGEPFNYKFNGDLFSYFHIRNINNITFGYEIEIDLLLPSSVINNLYNLTENYWLNSFFINTKNIKGTFVMISLEEKQENLYTGHFYYIYE